MPERPTFAQFAVAVERQVAAGATAYADRRFFNSTFPPLLDEVLQEVEDVACWNFILWCRPHRVCNALAFTEGTP
jgi:hypothetical protein